MSLLQICILAQRRCHTYEIGAARITRVIPGREQVRTVVHFLRQFDAPGIGVHLFAASDPRPRECHAHGIRRQDQGKGLGAGMQELIAKEVLMVHQAVCDLHMVQRCHGDARLNLFRFQVKHPVRSQQPKGQGIGTLIPQFSGIHFTDPLTSGHRQTHALLSSYEQLPCMLECPGQTHLRGRQFGRKI